MLFKIQHWPLADSLIIVAAFSGVVFFIPSLLISKFKEYKDLSTRMAYLIGAFGLIIYIVGFCFKLLSLLFAGMLMNIGMFVLILIVFPWYTWIKWKNKEYITSKYIFMVLAPMLFIIPAAIMNLNLERSNSERFLSQQEQQQTLFLYRQENNQKLVNYYDNLLIYPLIEQIHSRTRAMVDLIYEIERKMVEESEIIDGSEIANTSLITSNGNEQTIQYTLLSRPFKQYVVEDFLVSGCRNRAELDSALIGYLKVLNEVNPADNMGSYSALLDPSIYLPDEKSKAGEMTFIWGLHSLLLLKNSIITSETYIIHRIADNYVPI